MKKYLINLITSIVKAAMIGAQKELNDELVSLRLELDKMLADQATGRPLRMPNHLTIGEFNWMVKYLKDRRVEILNHQADIPKDIQEAKPTLKKVV
jgi:hypothetical protein